jgi:hypothetical protein
VSQKGLCSIDTSIYPTQAHPFTNDYGSDSGGFNILIFL